MTFCMEIAIVNGNNFWKFHDDTMSGTLWKKVLQTDRQTDGQTDGRTEVFLELLVAPFTNMV